MRDHDGKPNIQQTHQYADTLLDPKSRNVPATRAMPRHHKFHTCHNAKHNMGRHLEIGLMFYLGHKAEAARGAGVNENNGLTGK